MTLRLDWTQINIAYRVLTGADFDHANTTYQQALDKLVLKYTYQQINEAIAEVG